MGIVGQAGGRSKRRGYRIGPIGKTRHAGIGRKVTDPNTIKLAAIGEKKDRITRGIETKIRM